MSVKNRIRSFLTALQGREIAVTATSVFALLVIGALLVWMTRDRVPDFRQYEAGIERKAQFFDFMRPLIREENARVLEDRRRLRELAAEDDLGWLDRRWLRGLAGEYRLDPEDFDEESLIDALMRRVDAVPMSLALAQAAKESGWGTSRFARRGYNFFGEWCYEEGCGLVPLARAAGRSHEVRAFDSPRDSVANYIRNINTNRSYRELREARASLRAQDRPLSGLVLAEQLQRYSERGQAYVEEIKGLIRYNKLERSGA